MSAEELEDYARMTDKVSPLDWLIQTAKDVSNEAYYIRKDNVFQVPRGVMNRLIEAIKEIEKPSTQR
jgi:hypothetical protein